MDELCPIKSIRALPISQRNIYFEDICTVISLIVYPVEKQGPLIGDDITESKNTTSRRRDKYASIQLHICACVYVCFTW